MLFCLTKFSIGPADWSTSERMTSPSFPYLACSSLRWGMPATHGPHHVAQNSTHTTLPLSELSEGGLSPVQLIHAPAFTLGGTAPMAGSSDFLRGVTAMVPRPSGMA